MRIIKPSDAIAQASWIGVAAALIAGSLAPVTASADEASQLAFVERYCVDCHAGDDAAAGFVLDGELPGVGSLEGLDLWGRVFSRVEKGEMPPADADQPDARLSSAVLGELKQSLTEADRQRHQQFGRSEMRRLNRVEYANALKDLLALPHLELADKLPPDGLAHGYSKSSSALDFSHVMMTRYLEEADAALWQAIAKQAKPVPRETIRAELDGLDGVKNTLQTLYVQLKQQTGMPLIGTERDPTLKVTRGDFSKRDPGSIEDPLPHFDGVATFMHSRANHNVVVKPFQVKQSGHYKIRAHGWGLLNDHGKLLPSDRSETIAFYADSGRLLGRCDFPPNVPTTSECDVWLREGEPIEYLAVSAPNEWFKIVSKGKPRIDMFRAHGIGLQWFELEGPLDKKWPPESHRRLLGTMQLEPTEPQDNGLSYRVVTEDPLADARRLIRKFATRAYRRPVGAPEMQSAMKLVRARLSRKEPFVDALFAGYRAILTSPEFLLVHEQPGELDAYALATRLSLFLTNSPPDAPLRDAARSGELLNDQTLREHTERLLNSPKSSRFVEHFLDDWLALKDIRLTEPDENLYPEFNDLLGESMVEETQAFFAEMIKRDLGAMSLIDSDFLMINQRLAEIYDIDGVAGSHLRPVPIADDSVRGGLLTNASLLKITANGTTTSPVVRGTFAMTKLLGDPPPPPPPSVPAIEPDISGATTIREQLARHREDAACASCHQKIDPPGFALECFDVMGRYRDRYRATVKDRERGVDAKFNGKPVRYKLGPEVDAAGELPGGQSFTTINEFRDLLKSREQQIARNLFDQLIIYATGQPVGFADEEAVEKIMNQLAGTNFGVRSMIHEIVQSAMFRQK